MATSSHEQANHPLCQVPMPCLHGFARHLCALPYLAPT